MNTTELDIHFVGVGEVKGKVFTRVFENSKRYVYEVKDEDAPTPHYEVFDRKTTPVCVDFANRVYSETDDKEVYPKAKDFGSWAWTFNSFESAEIKANEL